MNEVRAPVLKPLISIAIVLLVVTGLFFVVRALPFETLGEIRPKRVVWWSLLLIALLQVAFLFLAAEIWRRVVGLTTGTQITLWSSYMQIALVTVGKYVPGKVWGFVARAGVMYRQQIPVHLSVMSSVVEQVLVVTGAVLIGIIAALIALPQYWLVVIAVGAFLVFASSVAVNRLPALTHWLLRRRYFQDVPEKDAEIQAGSVIGYTLAYGMLWILSGMIFSIIYFSLFDASITRESMAALILANTAGIVMGFFAFFVPGGIGVREAVATFVLAGFVPVREALLAAVCYRAWMVLIDGLNALFILCREASNAKRE